MSTIPRASETSPTPRKRPFGVNAVIVLSTLILIWGVVIIAGLIVAINTGTPLENTFTREQWLGIYIMVTSVIQVPIIIGLWRLKRWGWFLVMLHTGVALFINIWAYFYARPSYFAMAVSVLIVLYMNQREVQQAFIEPTSPVRPQETTA